MKKKAPQKRTGTPPVQLRKSHPHQSAKDYRRKPKHQTRAEVESVDQGKP